MNNLDIYNKYRAVPKEAQKPIQGGRLKGMTDINPMWRIKALTEEFGAVGKGWYYEVLEQRLENGDSGVIMAFVTINLFVKYDEEWSKPIVGLGGSSFVAKEKTGLYTSDECFKMAFTDALGIACKSLGIGANVWWNSDRSKYDNPVETPTEEQPKGKVINNATNAARDTFYKHHGDSGDSPEVSDEQPKRSISDKQIARLYAIGNSAGLDAGAVAQQIKTKLNKTPEELTRAEYDKICTAYEGLKKGDK